MLNSHNAIVLNTLIPSYIKMEAVKKRLIELRISKAWNRWRELTGVLCDKKIPVKLKVLIYKTAIRPALLYGNETLPFTERLPEKVNSCEMKILRYCLQIRLLA